MDVIFAYFEVILNIVLKITVLLAVLRFHTIAFNFVANQAKYQKIMILTCRQILQLKSDVLNSNKMEAGPNEGDDTRTEEEG